MPRIASRFKKFLFEDFGTKMVLVYRNCNVSIMRYILLIVTYHFVNVNPALEIEQSVRTYFYFWNVIEEYAIPIFKGTELSEAICVSTIAMIGVIMRQMIDFQTEQNFEHSECLPTSSLFFIPWLYRFSYNWGGNLAHMLHTYTVAYHAGVNMSEVNLTKMTLYYFVCGGLGCIVFSFIFRNLVNERHYQQMLESYKEELEKVKLVSAELSEARTAISGSTENVVTET